MLEFNWNLRTSFSTHKIIIKELIKIERLVLSKKKKSFFSSHFHKLFSYFFSFFFFLFPPKVFCFKKEKAVQPFPVFKFLRRRLKSGNVPRRFTQNVGIPSRLSYWLNSFCLHLPFVLNCNRGEEERRKKKLVESRLVIEADFSFVIF